MATRSSSCWVALNNMRFTYFSPARAGAMLPGCSVFSLGGKDQSKGPRRRRAFPVPSLLPVSEINHCTSGPGGVLTPYQIGQEAGCRFLRVACAHRVLWFLCLATRKQSADCIENE